MTVLFFDLGKTICRPGMNAALRNPRALGDIRRALADRGYRRSGLQLARTFWLVYREYQRQAEATLREQPAESLARRAMMLLGVEPEETGALAGTVVCAYSVRLSEGSRLCPGARGVLAGLGNEGYPMAVVTDGVYSRSYTDALLNALQVRQYFRSLTLSSEVGWRKPSPHIYDAACRSMDADPRQSIFIGDREGTDIRGAADFGMHTVLYRPGVSLRPTQAEAVIRHWRELPAAIQGIEHR